MTRKLKRYRVDGLVTISVAHVVEAVSKAHAIRQARAAEWNQSLTHHAESRNGLDPEEEWITSGELDGEVRIVGAEIEGGA